MTKTETTELTENPQPSRKREITAVAAATTVTVVLSVAANVFISKLAGRVQNRIAQKTETE